MTPYIFALINRLEEYPCIAERVIATPRPQGEKRPKRIDLHRARNVSMVRRGR